MKKILLYISILTVGLISCNTEDIDEVFDKSPEERVAEQINTVRNDLMSSEMGWLSTYSFNEGKDELVLLIKFIDENRAEITVPEIGNKKYGSNYRLSFTQQVDLIFDTHSFLAQLVDLGYKADFRWELQKKEDGKYFFKSIATDAEGSSNLVIDKASEEKLQLALKIQALKAKLKNNPEKSFFRNLEIGGKKYVYSYAANKVIFTELKDGEFVNYEGEITISEKGFSFNSPLTIDGVKLEEFEYSEKDESFKLVKPSGVDAIIAYGSKPFVYPNTADKFLAKNFKSISSYSAKLQKAIPILQQDVPNFKSFQIYTDWGYLLCYAPGTVGGNWAGFSKLTYTKVGEDEMLVTWDGYVYGKWWKQIYNNAGGKYILGFILDEKGLDIIPAGKKEVFLVSKTDPSKYCLVEF